MATIASMITGSAKRADADQREFCSSRVITNATPTAPLIMVSTIALRASTSTIGERERLARKCSASAIRPPPTTAITA